MLRTFRIYGVLIAAAFRAELQYRANLVLMMVAAVFHQGIGLAFVWAVLSRFDDIGGWTLTDIAFLYGMRLTAHGLWVTPFGQLHGTDWIVREGEFDRFLVRPANPLLQQIARRLNFMAVGDLVGGITLLTLVSIHADVDWSPAAILFLVLAVAGGALIEVAIQLAIAGLSFRMLSTRSIRITIDNVFNTFGNYPLKIFGGGSRFALTFMLPLAFTAYFPATVLLNRTNELSVPAWLAFCSPLVGMLLFAAAYLFWFRQTRHYSSAGS